MPRSHRLIVAAMIACAAATSAAGAAPEPYDCRFTERPPTIDGKLDDPAWADAVVLEGFSMPWLGVENKPAEKATRARLLWDREYLYVAADMVDGDLYADVTEHDGDTWHNDVFEIFLKPAADKPAYYEFHVNAANTRFDCFLPRRGHVARFRREREFHVESAVDLRGTLDRWEDKDEGWTVEMRIPWTDLMPTGGRPDPGAEWRFSLCRYDFDVAREKPELSTSLRTCSADKPDFHRHEDFAPLRFRGPEPRAGARPYGIPRAVAVTTSKVAGSPDPLPPYTVERVLPDARISCPVAVARQPGTDLLLYIDSRGGYMPTRVMRMRDGPGFAPETLIDVDTPDPARGTVHYSFAFHPRFAENGHVFITSCGPPRPGSPPAGPGMAPKFVRVTRYVIDRAPPYAFHPESAEVIIEWDSDGHNGGDLAFGPDGMLFITSGDGTSESDKDLAGQDLSRLRSKVLRIDVDHPAETVPGDGRHYAVPADNPFVGQQGVRPETWAYGFRNPWRMAFDPRTGDLWVGNNGQDLWEQIYLVERGANYGWSIVEGGHAFATERTRGPHPISPPIADHSHAEARSLTGGLVYQGDLLPELRGAYVYGDYSTGRVWCLTHENGTPTRHDLLADTTLQIVSFGVDSRGELLILDHRPDEEGGFYRLVRRPPQTAAREFPRRLSESGLFASVRDHRMAPGVIPYDVNSPLWSDGTHKARFFALPPTTDAAGRTVPTPIGVTPGRGWNFPDGTVIVKSFAIDEVEGDPATRRWIETRFMHKEDGEWAGYSYEWNDDQSDAELVAAGGKDRSFEIRTADLAAHPGGVRSQQWRYPSRAECMVCHSRASNFSLGLCTVQMNRDFDYEAALGPGHAVDNQLRTLEHLDLVRVDWWGDAVGRLRDREEARGLAKQAAREFVNRLTASADPDAESYKKRRSPLLSTNPDSTQRLADPHDPAGDLAARARSYLQSNCASCHMKDGGGNSLINLTFRTAFAEAALAEARIVDMPPMHHAFGLPDARVVAPGAPERSVLLWRVSHRGPGQMPQLATAVVDDRAVALLRDWIASLPPPAR